MHRLIHLVIAVLAFASLVADTRAQAPDQPVTPLPETYFPSLAPLLESARKLSPRMIARNADDAAAEANLTVARSGQLPSVSGNLQFNAWQRDQRADLSGATNSQKLNYNLNLTQPVYHWGVLENNTRMGELQLKISRGQTADAYRLLVQEIRSYYLQLVIKKVTLARARYYRDLAAGQLKLAEDKLKLKVMSELEAYPIRMNLTQANLAVDRAQEDYETGRRTLAKLSGTAAPADEQVPEAIPAIAVPMKEFETQLADFVSGKAPAPIGLKVLEDQIEIERLTYKNSTARLRPNLNLIVGMSQDEQSYTSNIAAKYKVQSYYVGTQLSWSIFDGFATRGVVAGSLARRRQLEQSFHELSDNLAEQGRSQLKQLGFAVRTMEITDQYLSSAENGVQVRKQDMARGQASQADVDTAQLALFDARGNAYYGRMDVLMRMAEFLSTLARDPVLANVPVPNS